MSIFNEVKPLIEWEKELGLWFSNLDYIVHYTYFKAKDFIKMLAEIRQIHAWDMSAEKIYNGLTEWQHFHPLCTSQTINNDEKIDDDIVSCESENNHTNVNIGLMRTTKKKTVPSFIFKMDESVKKNKMDKKDKIKSAFEKIHHNIKNMFTFSIMKSRKSKNKKQLNHSLIKRAIAFALTITTSVSAYAFSKLDVSEIDVVSNTSFVDMMNGANTNKFSITNDLFSKINIEDNEIKKDAIEVEKQEITSVEESKSKENILVSTKTDDTNKYDNLNKTEITLVEERKTDVKDIIHLGDKITIRPGSSIYATSDYAMEDSNREPLYYSYDKERQVCFIGFIENGNPIYVRTQEEYDACIEKGLAIESVGAEDGFYRDEDVVKVLKKV